MKCATHFLSIAVALNSVAAVFSFCSSDGRQGSDQGGFGFSYSAVSRIYNGSIAECECGRKFTCVRKCCDVDYYLDKNRTCVYNDSLKFKVPIFKYGTVIVDGAPRFIYGMIKCAFVEINLNDSYVQKDGKLWLPAVHMSFNYDQYCVELTEGEGAKAFFCSIKDVVDSLTLSYRLNIFGMAISLPFLLITFIVYAILPLRNLHGMSLMCYIFTLFATYVIHIFNYLYMGSDNYGVSVCRATTLLSMFFFLASFFWMNVMSYDIWWTFSGFINLRAMQEKSLRKYFLLYSAYAWISPLMIVGFVMSLRNNVKPNTWYDPGLTDQQCSLNDGIPTLMYYYGPMAILLVANIILFLMTAWKIRKVQKDTLMLEEGDNRMSHNDNKKRFYVYLKLYLAMGVNWSMEIISYVVSWKFNSIPRSTWFLPDFCNAAFGVVIFVIFVFKKSIWKLLKQRYRPMKKKNPYLAKPTTSLSFTGSSTTNMKNHQ